MGAGLFFCLIILIQMVHVLLLSQDSDGHLSKRGEGPARSLLGYYYQGEHLWRYGGVQTREGRSGVLQSGGLRWTHQR